MSVQLDLPPYLLPLPESDPAYPGLNESAYNYAYGPNPGDGMLKEFEVVTFVTTHNAYRVYGGNATACGYWWILAPDHNDCFRPILDDVNYTIFANDYVAVCPEWNTGMYLHRCKIPAGYNAVIGIGQSANCTSNGQLLTPDPTILQLNGDVCSASVSAVAAGNSSSTTTTSAGNTTTTTTTAEEEGAESDKESSCVSCRLDRDSLLNSTCVETCPSSSSLSPTAALVLPSTPSVVTPSPTYFTSSSSPTSTSTSSASLLVNYHHHQNYPICSCGDGGGILAFVSMVMSYYFLA
mmetsp:Transcript_53854/g.62186  ORF Transcript_53854/g.62186 Transcript_53854/m.62186 type:complete len:294 (+) Transcript_53854:118-999(+)